MYYLVLHLYLSTTRVQTRSTCSCTWNVSTCTRTSTCDCHLVLVLILNEYEYKTAHCQCELCININYDIDGLPEDIKPRLRYCLPIRQSLTVLSIQGMLQHMVVSISVSDSLQSTDPPPPKKLKLFAQQLHSR